MIILPVLLIAILIEIIYLERISLRIAKENMLLKDNIAKYKEARFKYEEARFKYE